MITVNPASMIIESKQKSIWIRIRDVMLTIIMWLAYLYLMQDFFHFLYTIFDWLVFKIEESDLPKALKILQTMEIYFWVVVFNSALLLSWAIYNQLRFQGKDRRKAPQPITTQDLEAIYNFPAHDIEQWQESRRLIIHHDEQGVITLVESTIINPA